MVKTPLIIIATAERTNPVEDTAINREVLTRMGYDLTELGKTHLVSVFEYDKFITNFTWIRNTIGKGAETISFGIDGLWQSDIN